MIEPGRLIPFVTESNKIEDIVRKPYKAELRAHAAFLAEERLEVIAVEALVEALEPGARLRALPGMNVRVGDHVPPPGSPGMPAALAEILEIANAWGDPWHVHLRYETLHPFMDGNGRSGRAIWLWQMLNQAGAFHALNLGFLHLFYYQTLGARRP